MKDRRPDALSRDELQGRPREHRESPWIVAVLDLVHVIGLFPVEERRLVHEHSPSAAVERLLEKGDIRNVSAERDREPSNEFAGGDAPIPRQDEGRIPSEAGECLREGPEHIAQPTRLDEGQRL
jgi:hypothetical protein